MAGILANCLKNINDFTKAYNILFSLRSKLDNAIKVIKDYDKLTYFEESHIADAIGQELTKIIALTGELLDSKKLQFLAESNGVY